MSAPKGLNARAAEAAQLYAEGQTQTEIARAFGVSRAAIFKLMKRHGIQARPKAGPGVGRWKGDTAAYQTLHDRVRTRYGTPQRCGQCGTTGPSKIYDWANLTGSYGDPDDYARMCRTCHRRYDMTRRLEGDLSTGDVAGRLQVSTVRVKQLIAAGRISARKAGMARNSPYRITEQAVADYLERRAS